jgi:hypothetical protein
MKTYAGGATTVGKDEYLMSSSIEEKQYSDEPGCGA